MKLAVAGLALAPLLIAQGRRVRRIALRLPEAAGPREGAEGLPEEGAVCPLRLLLVGDSSAAGVGAPTQDQALAGNLARALIGPAAFDRVAWRLEARTGAAAADALAMARALAPWPCDVAVLVVGVNDVTGATPPARWQRTVDRLVDTLRHRHGARIVVLSGLPPMHRFPLLPQPLRWYLGEQARRLDAALARRAAADPALRHLPLPAMEERSTAHAGSPIPVDAPMAADGFHPSPVGYRIWAGALADQVLRAMPSRSAGSPATAASASTK